MFKDNIEGNKKKIKYLKEVKDNNTNPEHVGTIHGVNVGDSELGDLEEKAANIWGNTTVTKEAKEVLKLQKFRLFPKLDSIAVKTEIEKGLTIIRWKEKVNDEMAMTMLKQLMITMHKWKPKMQIVRLLILQ